VSHILLHSSTPPIMCFLGGGGVGAGHELGSPSHVSAETVVQFVPGGWSLST
jgi:hypothetical protein